MTVFRLIQTLKQIYSTDFNHIPLLSWQISRKPSLWLALTTQIMMLFTSCGLKIPVNQIVRFTKLVFGLRPSPAILGAAITHHLSQYQSEQPQLVKQLEKCLYVDDLIIGTNDVEQAFKLYQNSKSIMKGAGLYRENGTQTMQLF